MRTSSWMFGKAARRWGSMKREQRLPLSLRREGRGTGGPIRAVQSETSRERRARFPFRGDSSVRATHPPMFRSSNSGLPSTPSRERSLSSPARLSLFRRGAGKSPRTVVSREQLVNSSASKAGNPFGLSGEIKGRESSLNSLRFSLPPKSERSFSLPICLPTRDSTVVGSPSKEVSEELPLRRSSRTGGRGERSLSPDQDLSSTRRIPLREERKEESHSFPPKRRRRLRTPPPSGISSGRGPLLRKTAQGASTAIGPRLSGALSPRSSRKGTPSTRKTTPAPL